MDMQKTVLEVLANRERLRADIDLTGLYRSLKADYPETTEQGVLDVFRTLQAQGAGQLIIGRKGNPNRFKLKYNLREVAAAALAGKKKFDDLPTLLWARPKTKKKRGPRKALEVKQVYKANAEQTKRGRPAGSKNKTREFSAMNNEGTIQLMIQLPKDTRKQDLKAFLELASELTVKKDSTN